MKLTNKLFLPGIFVFACALTLINSGCKKGNGVKPTPQNDDSTVPLDPGVYISGSQEVGGATLWKNGTPILLDGASHSFANSMVINGNDIYVAGTSETYPIGTAIYWKNNVVKKLTDGLTDAEAFGVAVSGKDVYVAGFVSASTTTQNLPSMVAAYWKNDVLHRLTNTGPSQAYGVIANGADVYVWGYAGNSEKTIYWKNGVLNTIGDTSKGVAVGGMAVQGNDLYIAYSERGAGQISISYVSKNGVKTQLQNDDPSMASYVGNLFINGSDVYVAGGISSWTGNVKDSSKAVYWKNGVLYKLPQPDGGTSNNVGAQNITVSGGDVYVDGDSLGAAVYWKNGVPEQIGARHSAANGIAIVH
jgi:hypothetical protein